MSQAMVLCSAMNLGIRGTSSVKSRPSDVPIVDNSVTAHSRDAMTTSNGQYIPRSTRAVDDRRFRLTRLDARRLIRRRELRRHPGKNER